MKKLKNLLLSYMIETLTVCGGSRTNPFKRAKEEGTGVVTSSERQSGVEFGFANT